ncbi:MAG: type II toxin-antitoxin system ParD family antitoxin [Alphaproteobacteria bacterium]
MSTVEKISIALTQDMALLVRQAVESGEYATNSEVIRDALRDWKVKRAQREQLIAELRGLWDDGVKSGPGKFDNIDALMLEAKRRFELQRQK